MNGHHLFLRKIHASIFVLLFSPFLLMGKEASPPSSVPPQKEEATSVLSEDTFVENQEVQIQGKAVRYDVKTGSLLVKSRDEKEKAHINFIAYFAKQESGKNSKARPIAFCFNGGPGSSSIWLHMGFLGPKIVDMQDLIYPSTPVSYKNNPFSLLSSADLVFVDPVSTGFSDAVPGSNPKCFYGVQEDIYSVAEFIRIFLTKFNRWDSQKYLIGESYGTFRAAGLAHVLQESAFINVDGIILISSVLDISNLDIDGNFDLPYVSFLPTYAVTAHYHKRLSEPYASMTPFEVLEVAKKFALDEYAPALALGDDISDSKKEEIAQKLSDLTSIPKERYIELLLRMNDMQFFEELLKKEGNYIGRFDGRVVGPVVPQESEYYDPSASLIIAPFTASFHQYLLNDLKCKREEPYRILSDVSPWRFDSSNGFDVRYIFDVFPEFRSAITKNPKMRVFVASGCYDFATPWLSQQYDLSHLLLKKALKKNITFKTYESGHMIYLNPKAREELFKDLISFIAPPEKGK